MCSTAMSPFINLQSLCFTSDAAGHSWRPRRHVAPLHSSSASSSSLQLEFPLPWLSHMSSPHCFHQYCAFPFLLSPFFTLSSFFLSFHLLCFSFSSHLFFFSHLLPFSLLLLFLSLSSTLSCSDLSSFPPSLSSP